MASSGSGATVGLGFEPRRLVPAFEAAEGYEARFPVVEGGASASDALTLHRREFCRSDDHFSNGIDCQLITRTTAPPGGAVRAGHCGVFESTKESQSET